MDFGAPQHSCAIVPRGPVFIEAARQTAHAPVDPHAAVGVGTGPAAPRTPEDTQLPVGMEVAVAEPAPQVPGGAIELEAVLDFSDALVFLICVPNLVGLYVLAPVVRARLRAYSDASPGERPGP